MTISPIQCTHTYTVSLCCCQGQLHLLCPSHTHTHTCTFLLVSLSCLRGTADTTTVLGFRAISVPAQSVLLRLQQQGHKRTHREVKKIIFHVCEISSNGCLGGVCSYRKLFQYDVTLNCPSNTLLININSGSCNCFF